jgi:hypothetical protein
MSGRRGSGRLQAPPFRLVLFVAGLAVLAGVAALVGRASGIDVDTSAAEGRMAHNGSSQPRGVGNGLSDTSAGFRLVLTPRRAKARTPTQLTLRIEDDDGRPVTNLDESHGEPPLHLILVRRDLTGYQHLHPVRRGTAFSVELTLPTSGVWRAYADFEVGGEKVVLGRDLVVPGAFTPQTLTDLPPSHDTGGYDVELSAGELAAGVEGTVRFDVARDGEPVELEPYLGADGHLVAIRDDDLAYQHVHPLDRAGVAGVAFDVEFAEAGRYALFLQFKHGGRVRAAPFTVVVSR